MARGKRMLLLGIVLVVVDQVIKVLVKTHMSLGEHFGVFGDWFQILFVENEGMAFGMAFGGMVGKLLLSLFRLALSVLLIGWIAKLARRPADGSAGRPVPMGVLVGLTLITAGAVGNLIDCLCYGVIWGYAPVLFGRVVDMFYFPLFTWPSWVPGLGGHIFFEPVFNFADSCVTVGAFYLILFQYRFFVKEEPSSARAK